MSDPASSAPDPLLLKIERFLAKTKMSAATFGLDAIGDPRFVYQLRRGREPRKGTIQNIISFLKDPDEHRKKRAAQRAA